MFRFLPSSSLNRYLMIVLVASVVLGAGTGYLLTLSSSNSSGSSVIGSSDSSSNIPTGAHQDSQTFKDFAEGTIKKKDTPKNGEYTEGTHVLVRTGAVPVALTSSVVDLSQYEGKKVKVFGETQKAIKEGWLMDVGKVEVQQ